MANHKRTMLLIGPMPPFADLGTTLWGARADLDSDGDADFPEPTSWRELTLILRPDYVERIDIDPDSEDRNRIIVRATSEALLERVCALLIQAGSARRI